MGSLIVIAFLFGLIVYGVASRYLLRRGFKALYTGDYDRAHQLYTWGTRLFPRSPHFFRGRAMTHVYDTDNQGRLDDVAAALQRSPRDTFLLMMHAQSLAEVGRVEEALEVCEHTLEIEPDDPLIYLERAHLLMNYTDDLDASLREVDTALDMLNVMAKRIERFGVHAGGTRSIQATHSHLATARSLKALVLSRQGRHDDAQTLAAAISSDENVTRVNLSEVALNVGDIEQAHTLLQQALEHEKQDAQAMKQLVDVGGRPLRDFVEASLMLTHYKRGDVDDALRLWRDLLARDSRFADPDWVKRTFNWSDPMTDALREMLPHVTGQPQLMDIAAP